MSQTLHDQITFMNIRKFIANDRPKVIALWKSSFPNDPPHNAPALVLDAKLAVDDLVFVVEQRDEIVGACIAGYDGHRGWLYGVAVAPVCRRQGVGSALIYFVLKELNLLGCKKVNLQIRTGNATVTAFYQALGFAVEERLSMSTFIQ